MTEILLALSPFPVQCASFVGVLTGLIRKFVRSSCDLSSRASTKRGGHQFFLGRKGTYSLTVVVAAPC